MPSTRPLHLAGGCLCGSIKYKIELTPDMPWPATQASIQINGTCQCTRCRKFTGGLIPQLLTVPAANIHPPLHTQTGYKAFQSPNNAPGQRVFCSLCGSSIAYHDRSTTEMEIYLGSLDEETLCGEKRETAKTEWGDLSERSGGQGLGICRTKRHIWVENAIPGLTDTMDGEKWLQESSQGKPFEGCGLADLSEKRM